MPKQNAFMAFAMDWKNENAPNKPLTEAVKLAGAIWEKMHQNEREAYLNRGSSKLQAPIKKAPRQTTLRTLVKDEAAAEKAKLLKEKTEIAEIKQLLETTADLKQQKFYFISMNFFIPESAVPAEIALIEFSLKDGVRRQQFWYVNNSSNDFYGMLRVAQEHVNKTHQLPLPPDAYGDLEPAEIYAEILNFFNIGGSGQKLPFLFTYNTYTEAVSKALNAMAKGNKEMSTKNFIVYSVQQLFFLLKCAIGESKGAKPKNIHVTNLVFERDPFEFEDSIACDYHRQIDRPRYCALSRAIRWAYTLADHMIKDLDLKIIPGKHCPQSMFEAQLDKENCEQTDAAKSIDPTIKKSKMPNLQMSLRRSASPYTVPEENAFKNLWQRNDETLPPDEKCFEIDALSNDLAKTAITRKPARGRGIAIFNGKTSQKYVFTRTRGIGRGIAILNKHYMPE